MTLYDDTGGFSYLLMVSYDAGGEEDHWGRNLCLLVHEVQPACALAETARQSRAEAQPCAAWRDKRDGRLS
jgi:hypothetical protein